jgi:hypothetical protein
MITTILLVFAMTLSICGLTFSIIGLNKEPVKTTSEPEMHPMKQLPIIKVKSKSITIHVAGNNNDTIGMKGMSGPNGPVPEGCIGFDRYLQPVCINETKRK